MTRAGRRALGLTLAAIVAATTSLHPGAALAQTNPTADELRVARETFAEAYRDEQDKRYAEALEKFRRVATVRESAAVRYRIASVLEALGRLRESRDAFRALAASKPGLPVAEREIADSAAERAHVLDKTIPRVALRLQANPPEGTRVSIDGAPVLASTTSRAVELDPGEHLIVATSPSSLTTERRVTLASGNEVEVVVSLTPQSRASTAPVDSPPRADTTVRHRSPLAYAALGAGGALVVSSVVLLVVRDGDISQIEKDCAGGTCPAAKRDDLESARDQARLFGPLGVGLGIVGVAAAGVGAYLLLRPAPASTSSAGAATTSTPHDVARARQAVRIAARPIPGGAAVGVLGSF